MKGTDSEVRTWGYEEEATEPNVARIQARDKSRNKRATKEEKGKKRAISTTGDGTDGCQTGLIRDVSVQARGVRHCECDTFNQGLAQNSGGMTDTAVLETQYRLREACQIARRMETRGPFSTREIWRGEM